MKVQAYRISIKLGPTAFGNRIKLLDGDGVLSFVGVHMVQGRKRRPKFIGKRNPWRLSPGDISHNLWGFCRAAVNRLLLPLQNQNLAPTHVCWRWFNWVDLGRNPCCVCFCSMGWGPWKAKVTIPRAPTYLSCFNICEAQGVPQNGMSDQTHSAKVCLNLCGPEPDLPRPFPGEEIDMFGAPSAALSGEYQATRRVEKRGGELWVSHIKMKFLLKASPSLSLSLSSLPRRESS